MTSSTVFTSNRSQAVRLPKAVAFPDDVHQVDILKIGRSRVIVPQGKRWDELFLNGPRVSEDFMVEREQPPAEEREPLCIASITLGEVHYGAEKSARRAAKLTAIEHFVARLDVLPFGVKAAAHYGQVRAELERAGTPCGPHDMQIGGPARREGVIVVTKKTREVRRMPGGR